MIVELGSAARPSSRSGYEFEKVPGYFRYGDLAVQRGVGDDGLAYAFTRFSQDDLLPIIFHDRPGIGIYEFMTLFRDPAANTLGAFHENPETMKWDLDGLLWVTDLVSMGPFKKCTVGMGFFRGVVDRDRIVTYAQLGLEWCFDRIGVDVVHGITPSANRAAILFGQRLGFQQTTPLDAACVYDGSLSPAVLSSITRDRWQSLRPWGEQ